MNGSAGGDRGGGVSVVIPVHNGERWLDAVLDAVRAQRDERPLEVVAVDDRSMDGSRAILEHHAGTWPVRIVPGEGRGAAAAINVGIRHAQYPVICQIDQDVIVQAGWMRRLTDALAEPGVAAAQGYYVTLRSASLWARVMGLDLAHRYAGIDGRYVDHVCTGNTAYRRDALERVGLFDEALGYGYDNDMSYRLGAAGYRLVFCREARSEHRWRETLAGYLLQQYGVGYGRLDLVAKHRRRCRGDDVSGIAMMAHAPAMLGILAGCVATGAIAATGGAWPPVAAVTGGGLALLGLERLAAGLRATARFGDWAGLAFLPAHLARDVAWAIAVLVWTTRRVLGRRSSPFHSLKPGHALRDTAP